MEAIEKAFRKIGARVRFGVVSSTESWRFNPSTRRMERPVPSLLVTVDVARDKKGEFFQVNTDGSVKMQLLNVAKDTGHMLLFAKDENDAKYRYLCGLDERGWFAAAVPEAVSSVVDAMEALKPDYVTRAQKGLSAKQRNKRKNRAFRRQGEWYFVPAPDFEPDQKLILRNEPIQRGRGSPHVVEEVFRAGGETVYVSRRHLNGLTPEQYKRLLKDNPGKELGMAFDAEKHGCVWQGAGYPSRSQNDYVNRLAPHLAKSRDGGTVHRNASLFRLNLGLYKFGCRLA